MSAFARVDMDSLDTDTKGSLTPDEIRSDPHKPNPSFDKTIL